ncbi:LemA family protein [Atopobium fossor]|uniref:LemA family protein n=1 Tax=Atopobium fossor TaxID=39487 RepID=UPI0003F57E7F|nr:LemA family protein [Atopobium fossor]
MPVIIAVVVVAALLFLLVGLYNNMVGLRNRCDNAWQTIDTQLQRRSDLIPNLVETVKGYAAHESQTLEAVIQARNSYVSASTPEQAMDANNQITGALRQLFALSESYPELKANTNFQQLQTDLSDTEDKISYARMSFNDCVLNYNNAIQTFPGVLIAGICGFIAKKGFEVASEAERQAPKVSF